MNNSSISLDSVVSSDQSAKLREEEARVIRIIEAIEGISSTKEWSTLKDEVFDKLVSSIEKDLRIEAKKDDPDPKKLNRLSGELKWAEKFSDLSKLMSSYKLDLQRIRTHQNAE